MTTPNGRHPAATDPEHPARFKMIAFKGASDTPSVMRYADPIEALVAAVEYLKQGYQVRLNDDAVAYFDQARGASPEPRHMSPAGPAS